MKIGIDCRMYGPKHTGIGRYVQNLVENLMVVDRVNEYVLFVKNKENVQCLPTGKAGKMYNVKFVEVNIPHYSLKEQLLFPSIIAREKLDVMHFPHFNVPVFYNGKYVVTIHDLIKHSSKGRETTTKAGWLYWLKYLGYKFVFREAVKRAEKIVVPSHFVKGEIVKEYGVDSNKIAVTYEGVDNKIKSIMGITSIKGTTSTLEKYKVKKPYLLYVGSVYPHKNIVRLIEAVKILKTTLVIVCARNVFSERLNSKVVQMKAGEYVKMVGYVPDEELACLYKEAEAFVFPTFSEGFGLPGLEAMALGCLVACSDIPVLREIYKDSAIYFDPLDAVDIVEKVHELLSNKKLQEKLVNSGLKLIKTYSWEKTAKETLSVYQTV